MNPLRANIIEDPEYPHDMMQCRPAGVSLADIQEMDPEMVIPNFAVKYGYGDKFQTQENLGKDAKAIIDFAYRGTPESVTYLAHELGHAIADDLQQQSGLNFRDFSAPELEAQAYLVQRIFSHYTGQGSPESEAMISNSGKDRLAQEWDRAGQYQEASGFFDQILLSEPAIRSSMVVAALGGGLENMPAPSPAGTEMSLE